MPEKCYNVLLIEDNQGDIRLIQAMLSEESGFRFIPLCANRLSEGITLLTQEDIDVILLDLGLPDSFGFNTFARVHAHAPDIPIVILTNFDDMELGIKGMQEGAQDYLVKNEVNSNLLVRSLYYAIERKQSQKHIIHLNSVLKAVRNVYHLIVLENDRVSLLQKVCDALSEAQGYDSVWLGLIQDNKTLVTVVGSSFKQDVSDFHQQMINKDHPPCIETLLGKKERIIIVDKSAVCGDCFLKCTSTGKEAAIIGIDIEHDHRLFGILTIALKSGITANKEEKELLNEVADDISFALNNLKTK